MLRTYNKNIYIEIRSVSVSIDIIYFTDHERRKIITMCIPVLKIVSVFLMKANNISLCVCMCVCVHVCVCVSVSEYV
jgi:hypothetical protein